MLYIDSFLKFGVSALSFKYGKCLLKSSDLTLPVSAGSSSQFCKRKGRVHMQHPLWGPQVTLPHVQQSGTNWSTLEKPRPDSSSGLCEILYMRFACISVIISFYIHKWKTSWMKKEIMGEGDVSNWLTETKGSFLSWGNCFLWHFP